MLSTPSRMPSRPSTFRSARDSARNSGATVAARRLPRPSASWKARPRAGARRRAHQRRARGRAEAAEALGKLEGEAARRRRQLGVARAKECRQAPAQMCANEGGKTAAHDFALVAFEKVARQCLDARMERMAAGGQAADNTAPPGERARGSEGDLAVRRRREPRDAARDLAPEHAL